MSSRLSPEKSDQPCNLEKSTKRKGSEIKLIDIRIPKNLKLNFSQPNSAQPNSTQLNTSQLNTPQIKSSTGNNDYLSYSASYSYSYSSTTQDNDQFQSTNYSYQANYATNDELSNQNNQGNQSNQSFFSYSSYSHIQNGQHSARQEFVSSSSYLTEKTKKNVNRSTPALSLRNRRQKLRNKKTTGSISINLLDRPDDGHFQVPEITGTYDKDYNIIHLDYLIRKKIKSEQANTKNLRTEIEQLQFQLEHERQTLIEYRLREKKILEYEKEITYQEKHDTLKIYQDKSIPLIQEYKKIKKEIENIKDQPQVQVTSNSNDDQSELKDKGIKKIDKSDKLEKLEDDLLLQIRIFLDLAQEYIPINLIYRNYNKSHRCLGCRTDLSDYYLEHESSITCQECGALNPCKGTDTSSASIKRINTSTRNDYRDQDNFYKFIMSFQGISNAQLDNDLIEALDTYFNHKSFPDKEEIKKMDLTNEICRGPTNHRMLYEALSSIGRSDLNICINLVGHVYWNWQLPDISKYVDKIMDHYSKTQQIFFKIPNRKRQSSIGRQWRLYKHLQLLGLPYQIDMFKISDMEESVSERNYLWKIMCDEADDPEIYYMED